MFLYNAFLVHIARVRHFVVVIHHTVVDGRHRFLGVLLRNLLLDLLRDFLWNRRLCGHVVEDERNSYERPDTSLSCCSLLCEVSKHYSLELLLQDTRPSLRILSALRTKDRNFLILQHVDGGSLTASCEGSPVTFGVTA